MANTFKIKTKAAVSNSSLDTVYTVPSATTTIVLGMSLCNITSNAITADVQLVSDTSDTETNANIFLLKSVSIPANTTLEVFGGQKLVLQTTDVVKAQASAGSALDMSVSIMEQT
tara:strand:+ start:146 stop:490 length:345 start_codon:yes stop_codon:yes gene_type:complete